MAPDDGLRYPDNLGYVAETHEWARLEDGVATIGISDYAQHEIGDVVFVELPQVGEPVTAEEDFGVIESVKSAFDIFAPMGGQVVEVNKDLEMRPELLNDDPYGAGWMIRIRVSSADEFKALLSAAEYRKAVEGE